MLDTLADKQWGNKLLCVSARSGCVPMIQRLLSRANHIEELRTKLWRDSRPISEAILGNHVAAVECLLNGTSLKSDLLSPNSQGEDLLDIASVHCNPKILRLLALHLQNVIQQVDIHGETTLKRIIGSNSDSQGRHEAAKILLSYIYDEPTTLITA